MLSNITVGLKQKYGEIINAKRKKEQKMSTDFITKYPFSFNEVMDRTDLKIFEENKHNNRRNVCLVDPEDQYIWLGFVEGRTDIVEIMTRFGGNEVNSMLVKISNAISFLLPSIVFCSVFPLELKRHQNM